MSATKKPAAILDKAGIEATIKRITSTGKKLDADIQAAGVGCLAHIEQHGDVTLFNRLYLALPKGARKSALTAWGLAFGKLVANTGDNKKEAPFLYDKAKTTDMAACMAQPWFDFSPDKAPDAVFDIAAAIASIIKRASKATTVTDEAMLTKLHALVNSDE